MNHELVILRQTLSGMGVGNNGSKDKSKLWILTKP